MDVEELIAQKKIIRSSRRSLGMEIKQGVLVVRAPYFASDREISRFINNNTSWIEKQLVKLEKRIEQINDARTLTEEEIKALAKEAAKVIPERVAFYADIIGVTYGRITIRCQKTRWGSCSAKGNLNFNCLLMLAPPEVLDSVVVHELCHRREMNHSQRFYSEVVKAFPEYHKWNRWLKDNGSALMARAPGNSAY